MSYSTGTVYKIICNLDSNFVYIGSTFNEIRHRWQDHKRQYKCWLNNEKRFKCSCFDYFKKYGIDNFSIIKIKEYVCYKSNKLDKKHLHAYEQLWINKTRNCCNKCPAFSPLKKQKINENKRLRGKKYYENNKEKIKEKIKCNICGSMFQRCEKARHQKSNKCISFSN